jgi:hypothetical protein
MEHGYDGENNTPHHNKTVQYSTLHHNTIHTKVQYSTLHYTTLHYITPYYISTIQSHLPSPLLSSLSILPQAVLTSLLRTFELLNPPPDVTTPPCVEEHTISPTPEHWKFNLSSSGRVRLLCVCVCVCEGESVCGRGGM